MAHGHLYGGTHAQAGRTSVHAHESMPHLAVGPVQSLGAHGHQSSGGPQSDTAGLVGHTGAAGPINSLQHGPVNSSGGPQADTAGLVGHQSSGGPQPSITSTGHQSSGGPKPT